MVGGRYRLRRGRGSWGRECTGGVAWRCGEARWCDYKRIKATGSGDIAALEKIAVESGQDSGLARYICEFNVSLGGARYVDVCCERGRFLKVTALAVNIGL